MLAPRTMSHYRLHAAVFSLARCRFFATVATRRVYVMLLLCRFVAALRGICRVGVADAAAVAAAYAR